jgi:7TM diverse intracellular signalling
MPLLPLALLSVITSEELGALLRHDLPTVAVATIFVSAGLGTVVLYRLRQRSRDRALLWFGMFSILYGLRLLAATDVVPDAFDAPEHFWRYWDSVITYVIALPIMLLLWEIFPSWRVTLRWLLWAMAAFAVTGIACDAIQGKPRALSDINNVIVLAALTAFLVALFRQHGKSADLLAMRVGLLAFCSAVVVQKTLAGCCIGRCHSIPSHSGCCCC